MGEQRKDFYLFEQKSVITNILGTEYKILELSEDEDDTLKERELNGYFDGTTKRIVLRTDYDVSPGAVGDIIGLKRKVLRHELIHAYLYESGLSYQCYWAENEEMVDWFAIQMPKLADLFEKLNIMK